MNKVNKSLKYYQIETYIITLVLQLLVIFFSSIVLYKDYKFGLISVLLFQIISLIIISIVISLCLLFSFENYSFYKIITRIKDNIILVMTITITNFINVGISFLVVFITSAVTIMTFAFGYVSYINTVVLSIIFSIFQMYILSYFTYGYYIYIDKNKKTNILQSFKKSAKYINNNKIQYTGYTTHLIGQYFTLASLSILYSLIGIIITQIYFNSTLIDINLFKLIVFISMEVLILSILLSYVNNIIENAKIYKRIEKDKKLMLYKELESLIKEEKD